MIVTEPRLPKVIAAAYSVRRFRCRFDEAVAGSPQDEDEVDEEQAPTSSRDTRKRKVNYNQDEPSIEALLEQGFSEGSST